MPPSSSPWTRFPPAHYLNPDPSCNPAPPPSDGIWGLRHSDIDIYPPIAIPGARTTADPASPALPVRRITAAQFAALHAQFDQTDVPGTVVFPWLYGSCLGPSPPPKYRGMVTVRADMPAPGAVLYRTVPASSSAAASTAAFEPVESLSSDCDVEAELPPTSSLDSFRGASEASTNSYESMSLDTLDSCSRHSLSAWSSLSLDARASITSTTTSVDSTDPASALDSPRHKQTPSLPLTAQAEQPDVGGRAAPMDSAGPPPLMKHPKAVQCVARGRAGGGGQGYEPQPHHSHLVGSFDIRKCLYAPLQAGERAVGVETNAGFPVADHAEDAVISASAMDMDSVSECHDAWKARFQPALRPIKQDLPHELRNFGGQYSLYSTIADVFIYCPAGLHSGAIELAQWVAQAQATHREEMIAQWGDEVETVPYNVFIVEDPFDAFERHYPSLVAAGSDGQVRSAVDFEEDERNLLQVLTRASEIAPNVFVRIGRDMWHNQELTLSDLAQLGGPGDIPHEYVQDGQVKVHNPAGYAVVIHAENGFDTADQTQLYRLSRCLDSLELQTTQALRKDKELVDREGSEVTTSACGTPAPTPAEVAAACDQYCQATGPLSEISCAAPQTRSGAVNKLIDLAMWIHRMAEPSSFADDAKSIRHSSKHRTRSSSGQPSRTGRSLWGKKLLIYSNDGYMGVAVIALTLLMYRYSLGLPQAMMYAHNSAKREMHVYPDQLPLLRSIEAHIHSRVCLGHAQPRRPSAGLVSHVSATVSATIGVPYPLHSNTSASSTDPASGRTVSSSVGADPGATDCVHQRSASFTRVPLSETVELEGKWVNHPSFTGSLASRILPQLYLGSADHAINVGMLRAQKITHVLSVGESPLTQSVMEQVTEDLQPTPDTLWGAHALGLIELQEVPGLPDDGLQPLRDVLVPAVEFIHSCILQGGTVLVHCRAGVSRSVTVIIAYLMAHANMSLEDAYSFTRARRLAVLIQPTLLFFWELRNFQIYLASRSRGAMKEEHKEDIGPYDPSTPSGPILRNSWLSMSALIARANVRYGYAA